MKSAVNLALTLLVVPVVVASGAAAQISGSGANGLILDPYIATYDSFGERGGDCWGFPVPIEDVAKRCGDDDGCSIRLVSDLDAGLYRASTPSVAFVMDAGGILWSQTLGDDAQSEERMNGDGVGDDLLVARNGVNDVHCGLRDDSLGTPPNLTLRVCHRAIDTVRSTKRSCTLRIDD